MNSYFSITTLSEQTQDPTRQYKGNDHQMRKKGSNGQIVVIFYYSIV